MSKILAGKIEAIRTFSTITKTGKDKGTEVERTMVTINVNPQDDVAWNDLTEDDFSTITFMLAKGDAKYNAVKALEVGNWVRIRASRVTETNGYINVAIDAMVVLGEGEQGEYIKPEIDVVIRDEETSDLT